MEKIGDMAGSFGTVAETYDRVRPGPAPAAVDWLVPAGCGAAADLAAGTGLFTRALLGRVPEITAVEPDARMRAVLAERTEGVRVLDGRGELIPLPDASVDGVFVSTAWHWFDQALAMPEIARVLRDGGRLGVIWTSRDRADDWVAELDLLRLSAVPGGAPSGRLASRAPRIRCGIAGPSSLGNPAARCALRARGGRVVHVYPADGR
jgi:ubiquinone/menaquinone biosynthesis C-methylase UbiE